MWVYLTLSNYWRINLWFACTEMSSTTLPKSNPITNCNIKNSLTAPLLQTTQKIKLKTITKQYFNPSDDRSCSVQHPRYPAHCASGWKATQPRMGGTTMEQSSSHFVYKMSEWGAQLTLCRSDGATFAILKGGNVLKFFCFYIYVAKHKKGLCPVFWNRIRVLLLLIYEYRRCAVALWGVS